MTEQEQRAAVVAEALTWTGTPFIHQAGVKGAGVDCAHLCDAVYVSQGLAIPTKWFPYGADWFKHAEREDKYIIDGLKAAGLHEIPFSEVGIGDTVIARIGPPKGGGAYAHCGIIVELGKNIQVICAWPTKERVQTVNMKEDRIFKDHDLKFFSPWHIKKSGN